ncbi:hypothetical protein GQ600_15340 [Phytophthora cactorum]|nr:hypothetical protein GQ600_15340 [Phytophthora cactorum]
MCVCVWGGGGASSRCRTKRMEAWYDLTMAPHLITEQQWIGYFKLANMPLHIDYASVDEAMKTLQIKTAWPDLESRMMNLQADLEAILDQFNLTDVAFEHEQRRIVKYLANALAPASFKAVIATKLTLHGTRSKRTKWYRFCSWVTQLIREFMTWECIEPRTDPPTYEHLPSRQGGRGARGGRGGYTSRNGTAGSGHDDVAIIVTKTTRCHRRERLERHACIWDKRVEGSTWLIAASERLSSCQPGEAAQLLKALDELREAAFGATVRRFKVVEEEERVAVGQDVEADRGTVAAEVDGVAVKALLLDSVADMSTVARGVLDVLQRAGKAVTVDSVNGVRLDQSMDTAWTYGASYALRSRTHDVS